MTLDNTCQTKPKIDYPTDWGFKIIGRDEEQLKICVAEIMADRKHLITPGNASKTGKFHSLNTRCEVHSEEERNSIFKAFGEHDAVDMVI